MQCPRCQHENPPQTKFCLECGTPFAATSASGSPVRSYSDQQRALTDALGQLRTRDRELVEALDQQTATAEILRVISTSPKEDLQPVLDAVAKSAARFCGADDGEIFHLLGEGLKVSAHHGPIPSPTGRVIPVVRGSVAGRAVLERRPVQVADLQEETRDFALGSALARESGYRTTLVAPLLREGTVVGTINLRRVAKNPFTDKQIALLQTFADQAVIALENVRLFTELEARNRDLTATSEILQVIASSPTDVQPVFDTIMRSIVRLCGAKFCVAYRYDGEHLHMVAHDNLTPETLASLNARYPQPPSRETATGISTLERRIVHIPDSTIDDLPPASREFARQQGWGTSEAASRIWQPRTGSQRCTN
jgi:two-component system, NtrC family, sensor kinase